MNEQEAQKFLAKQLKEVLYVTKPGHILWYDGYNPSKTRAVLETEFDYIARLVEGKLTAEEQRAKYITELWKLHQDSSRDDLYSWSQSYLSQRIWWWLTHADYVQRATALKQTIGEE